jgi:hypothetical protein
MSSAGLLRDTHEESSSSCQLGHSDRWLILKKPFDNIEVLQVASALTEKWRLAEIAKRRVQDLETQLAAANKQLALQQPERANEMYYGRPVDTAAA